CGSTRCGPACRFHRRSLAPPPPAARTRAARARPRTCPSRAKASRHAEQFVHRRLVRRRERGLIELPAPDPPVFGHPPRLELVADECALVEEKVDDVVLIRVADEADQLADLDVRAEAVHDFTLQRLYVGLARLDASAWELPHERKHRGCAALCDEILAVL